MNDIKICMAILSVGIVMYLGLKRGKKREDGLNKARNIRRRYSYVVTELVIFLNVAVFFLVLCLSRYIVDLLSLKAGYVFILIWLGFSEIFNIVRKHLYIPCSRRISIRAKVNIKKGQQKWYYYLFIAPASSLNIAVCTLPGGTMFKEFYQHSKEHPPVIVRLLLVAYTYGLTTVLLLIFDAVLGFEGIRFNYDIVPFYILLLYGGNMVLKIFDEIEDSHGKKMNETIKFISFLFCYTFFVEWLHFMQRILQ